MKSKNGEDERHRSHRKASDGFSQRQEIGAAKGVRIGRLPRGVFHAKAKTRANSQTKNGIKREAMEQFSNNFQTTIHLQDTSFSKKPRRSKEKALRDYQKIHSQARPKTDRFSGSSYRQQQENYNTNFLYVWRKI